MPPAMSGDIGGSLGKGSFRFEPTDSLVEDDIEFLILLPPLPSTGMTCPVYNGTQGLVYARQVLCQLDLIPNSKKGGSYA